MKVLPGRIAGAVALPATMVFFSVLATAHVTLRPTQPLHPGAFATVSLVVPNERHVDTTRITLEVPEPFLKAGGRLSRVQFPPGWQVNLEKEDKPGEVYRQEQEERAQREARREGGAKSQTEEERREQKALDELRKKWIKKATFEGATIPPDGFMTFSLSFELPLQPGKYQFSATQTFADGKELSWSEVAERAEHPTPSIVVERSSRFPSAALLLACAALLLSLLQFVRGRVHQNKFARMGK